MVLDGEFIPCDILLMHSSAPLQDCKIQTANLDGERTLKTKVSIDETHVLFRDQVFLAPQELKAVVN